MYDLFFGEGKTSRETVKSLMDIFALLNALLSTGKTIIVIGAPPGGFRGPSFNGTAYVRGGSNDRVTSALLDPKTGPMQKIIV